MLASALIDTSALWKIIAVGFAGGAGVVVAFGFVVLGTSRFAQARHGGVTARGGYALIVLLGAAFCVAAVVLGFWAMTKK
jgi:hypothetical protein